MKPVIAAILITFLTLSCSPAALPDPSLTPSVTGGLSSQILPNLIIQQQGDLRVRRLGSDKLVRIGLGTEVQVGDVLRVSNGKATVFCGNEIGNDTGFFTFLSGKDHGVPCPSGRLPRSSFDVTGLRGELNTPFSTPYALSPRSGRIREDRPTLRWHAVAGVDEYEVSIESTDGLERPPVRIHGNEIPYPDEWPALQGNGADYRVILRVAGSPSEGSESSNPGFTLLPESDEQQLSDQIDRIRQRSISEPALSLLQSHLYLHYGLRSEAVDVLLGIPDGYQIAAVQRLLGETYLDMGLLAEAEQAYQQALGIAEQDGLPEDQAAAYLGLGQAACGMAETEKAQTYYAHARDLYQKLEQVDQVESVSKFLVEGNKQCAP